MKTRVIVLVLIWYVLYFAALWLESKSLIP